MDTVKELALENVNPKEVFAGLDALQEIIKHSKESWCAKFLEEHDIEVREC